MTLISFAQVAARYGCSRSTADRWSKFGLTAADGTVVRMPYFRRGRYRFTTTEAVDEFLERCHADRWHGRSDPVAQQREREMQAIFQVGNP